MDIAFKYHKSQSNEIYGKLMSDTIFAIDVSKIAEPTTHKIKLPHPQCSEIADRFKIPKIFSLNIKMTITPINNQWELSGNVMADVQLQCVKSSELFEKTFEIPFLVILTHHDIDNPDLDVELIENPKVDIGDIALQYLALEIPINPLHPSIETSEENTTSVYSDAKNLEWIQVLEKLKQQK